MTTLRITSAILFIVFVGLTIVSYQKYSRTRDNNIESAKQEIIVITRRAANEINNVLLHAENSVRQMVGELQAGNLKKTDYHNRLKSLLAEDPKHYSGTTITHRPYGYNPDRRLHSIYYFYQNNKPTFSQLDEVYDYLSTEWYMEAMLKGPRWTGPYFDSASKMLMVTFSMPFQTPGETEPLGVVTVDISMDNLKGILENLDLGPAGFPAMTTAEGLYLYHPVTEYVIKGRTLLDIARQKQDRTRISAAPFIGRGEEGFLEHTSSTTSRQSWFVFAPILATNWSLQNTFIKDSIQIDTDTLRHAIFQTIVFGILSVLIGITFFLRKKTTAYFKYWAVVTVAFILFSFGILSCWLLSLDLSAIDQEAGSEAVVAKSALIHLQNTLTEASHDEEQQHILIPTGILVEKIAFTSSNNVVFSGFLWQKYPKGVEVEKKLGVSFVGAEVKRFGEVYQVSTEESEIFRWRFTIVTCEELDYRTYPIDQVVLRLRMRHVEFNNKVALIPDLDAYKLISPSLRPGLEQKIFLPGWELVKSYFSFKEKSLDTDFGVAESFTQAKTPDLIFNIQIRRNFLNAFISNLTPLILVAILLFMLLAIAEKIEVGRFIGICVGMFLVVVFSHVDVRSRIDAQKIFYLESFYFVTYLFLLNICLIRILLELEPPPKLVTYNNNLILKLSYWPLLAGTLYLVSIFFFY